MGKLSVVFAGQGAQFPGMGKELYENFDVVKNVFDEAQSMRPGLKELCFEGSASDLAITANTQPCMYVMEYASYLLLKELGIKIDAFAGFSLGEVAALAAAGVFSFEDGFRFVTLRAKLMDDAAKSNPGSMAACLKLSSEAIVSICEKVGDVWAVNFNCEGQTVISGKTEAVAEAVKEVAAAGGKAIPLAVSGAFHSPFMNAASEGLYDYLKNVDLRKPLIDLYSNISAKCFEETDLAAQISRQVISPVKWSETITNMISSGVDTFIEIGPGKVLSGLIKKIAPEALVLNVSDVAGVEKLKEAGLC